MCVNGTKTGVKHVCKLLASNRNVFADCFYAVHTHQLEFANTSLPTLVCRVKAASNKQTELITQNVRGILADVLNKLECGVGGLQSDERTTFLEQRPGKALLKSETTFINLLFLLMLH